MKTDSIFLMLLKFKLPLWVADKAIIPLVPPELELAQDEFLVSCTPVLTRSLDLLQSNPTTCVNISSSYQIIPHFSINIYGKVNKRKLFLKANIMIEGTLDRILVVVFFFF